MVVSKEFEGIKVCDVTITREEGVNYFGTPEIKDFVTIQDFEELLGESVRDLFRDINLNQGFKNNQTVRIVGKVSVDKFSGSHIFYPKKISFTNNVEDITTDSFEINFLQRSINKRLSILCI